MTYQDHRPDLRMDRQQDMGATPRQARWSWVVAAALVIALGLVFYGIDANRNGQKTANPPAVTVAPAPAAGGVAPPAPQTTTGQAAPPAVPETTGRGASPSQGA